MTYYGISLSAGQLGGNIYLVFFLTNIITIPANFLAIFLIDNYGRKKVMIITLTSTAASMICAALFPHKEASMGMLFLFYVKYQPSIVSPNYLLAMCVLRI